jgi:hypothetical protein
MMSWYLGAFSQQSVAGGATKVGLLPAVGPGLSWCRCCGASYSKLFCPSRCLAMQGTGSPQSRGGSRRHRKGPERDPTHCLRAIGDSRSRKSCRSHLQRGLSSPLQRGGTLCCVTKASYTWERAGARRHLHASDEGRREASTETGVARGSVGVCFGHGLL